MPNGHLLEKTVRRPFEPRSSFLNCRRLRGLPGEGVLSPGLHDGPRLYVARLGSARLEMVERLEGGTYDGRKYKETHEHDEDNHPADD